jgi:hypothetical protein
LNEPAQILDAPYAAIVQELLHAQKSVPAAFGAITTVLCCPETAASIARYQPVGDTNPLHVDFFGLGSILYELITFEKLPAQDQIPAALAAATLKAAQEDAPVPPRSWAS